MVKRYMPEQDGSSIAQIVSELDCLVDCGYRAIQITAPYESAGFFPWWGLRPSDYFKINACLGTSMDDFYLLSEQCHQRGLKLIAFLNLGYTDVTSKLWKKACKDSNSWERQCFLWSPTGTEYLKTPGNAYFRQGGGWQWSTEAQCYYWCFWNQDGYAEPQYDWSSPVFQAYAKNVLRFWMDSGLDGVILDAVNWYLNCDWETIRTCAVDIIHAYPDALCIPEGAGGFGDDPISWIVHGGFDVVEDQSFESDLHWNGSAVLEAVLSGNPGKLESRLHMHDRVLACGKITWSYFSWGTLWTESARLLEIAVLIGTGHMTEMIPSYFAEYSKKAKEQLRKIIGIGRHPGLVPGGSRLRLKTQDDNQYYAILKSQAEAPVLCVYNFQNETRAITVDLNSYISINSTWYDLLTGKKYDTVQNQLTVVLPPLGFGFYGKYL